MTASTATLDTLRDRVEQFIEDVTNSVIPPGAIDEGINQALDIYSKARPTDAIAPVASISSSRELDISNVTGLMNITRVWQPYNESAPDFPPNWRNFEHWQDEGILYFVDDGEPQADEVARIFYTKKQTLNGLNSETETTWTADDDSLMVRGAAGYAVLARSRKITELATVDRSTNVAEELRQWSEAIRQEFRDDLEEDTDNTIVVKQLTRKRYYNRSYPPQQHKIGV